MAATRRSFIQRILSTATVLGISGWPLTVPAKSKSLENMMVHQVYFWLKDPQNKESWDKLKSGLEKLLTISTIESGHLGTPAATEARDVVDNTYSFSYHVHFKSLEDHDSYQQDPVHLEFIEECRDLWDKVQVYDYHPM